MINLNWKIQMTRRNFAEIVEFKTSSTIRCRSGVGPRRRAGSRPDPAERFECTDGVRLGVPEEDNLRRAGSCSSPRGDLFSRWLSRLDNRRRAGSRPSVRDDFVSILRYLLFNDNYLLSNDFRKLKNFLNDNPRKL